MSVGTYRNPILPGFNPDPSICHIPNVGYFVTTSTFEFFPGLPIYFSKDLVNWKLIGHAVNRRSQGVDMRTVESSAGLWAPTLRYHKGKVYMICSCFWRLRIEPSGPEAISSGFYMSTEDIFDDLKWSDAIYFDEVGFDQDLLFDDDDRVYQTVTRFDFAQPTQDGNPKIQSFINEIELATGNSISQPVLAKASEYGVAEGCHILKKDGWYYFFTAEGGTQDGHRECVYRSRNPTGPFEAPPDGINPLIFNHEHPDIQNTGHMDLIAGDDGKWIAVFLGVRPVFEAGEVHGAKGMPTHLGRESFMAPVEWIDGWPVVNKRKPIALVGEAEGLAYVPEETRWRDDFDSGSLSLGWYHIRVPLKPCYSLTERPGSLAIKGGAHGIDVAHSPAVLLQKQTRFDCTWSTELNFAPTRQGEEAGTLVWLHEKAHAALGVKRRDDALEVIFRWPEGGKMQVRSLDTVVPLGSSIILRIHAKRLEYRFSFEVDGRSTTLPDTIKTSTFTPLFTGVHLGLYAQGACEVPCSQYAYFKYAQWEAA